MQIIVNINSQWSVCFSVRFTFLRKILFIPANMV